MHNFEFEVECREPPLITQAPAPRVEARAIVVYAWVGSARAPHDHTRRGSSDDDAYGGQRDRGIDPLALHDPTFKRTAWTTLLLDIAGPTLAAWYDSIALCLHVLSGAKFSNGLIESYRYFCSRIWCI